MRSLVSATGFTESRSLHARAHTAHDTAENGCEGLSVLALPRSPFASATTSSLALAFSVAFDVVPPLENGFRCFRKGT